MGDHWQTLIPVLLLGMLFFGSKKLPEMGSSLGKTIREFQKSMREVTNPPPASSLPQSAAQPVAQPLAQPEATPATGATPLVEMESQSAVSETTAPQIEAEALS